MPALPGAPVRPAETQITIAVSAGELVDKVTILEIKADRIRDRHKRQNILSQLATLTRVLEPLLQQHPELPDLKASLKSVNEALWQVEDDIRECERNGDFGPRFVTLARSVYCSNDRRSAIKREIDALTRSEIVEEKSYTAYD
jgi:hypothetical protein